MSARTLLLDLAARGACFPIGTDLVLSEQSHPEVVKLDGAALGRVMIEAARRWNTPLAVPLMDLAVEKEWLGLALGVARERVDGWHIDGVVPPRLPSAPPTPRLAANAAAIRHVAAHSDLIACGMCIGPFSLMTKLVSDPITPVFTAGLGETDEDVERVEHLVDLCTDVVLHSIDAQIDAGVRALMVCEPAANTVYFSPKQLAAGADTFERYVMTPNRRIATRLAERGVALIFHDCGELTPGLVGQLATLRPAMLSLGASRLLWEDATLVPRDIVLYGNLPSKQFYSDATMPVGRVRELAGELVQRMRATGHPFILGSECDVLNVPGAEIRIREKVKAFLSA